MDSQFDNEEVHSRYAGQLAVSGFSAVHQQKLKRAKVLLLGSGPVVRAAAQGLIVSGIGALKIIDNRLAALNSLRTQLDGLGDCQIAYQLIESLSSSSAELELQVASCDLVIDVLHDWQEKLSLSDLCMASGKPLLHCGGAGMRFQLFCMVPGKSCCLRCLLASLGLEDAIGSRESQGVLESLAGIIGNSLALGAVKIISAFGASQGNELIKIDGLSGELEVLRGFDPVSDCPDCGIVRRKSK
ncbi:MAG: hypothetical protein C0508_27005 [Cyanobacteria bacterium PR.023]|jgi:molybdopterin/thiamine biosynthesis adenylyltransferase|nr:hypothetical protein [Cyanobacteria bacterium PR.023]